MTHVCCQRCRLRFTPGAAAYLVACPECGARLEALESLELMFGFRVFSPADIPGTLPEAAAVSIPVPEPDGPGS
jgi:hypothetical protein